ncbi:hypothetical protein cypCar_00040097, partial [Cyprinus carpio]
IKSLMSRAEYLKELIKPVVYSELRVLAMATDAACHMTGGFTASDWLLADGQSTVSLTELSDLVCDHLDEI